MRRRFQFSLRTLLVTLTMIAVWLGVEVDGVRRQQEAVKAVLAAGGTVYYDYPTDFKGRSTRPPEPNVPLWLREFLGDDFFRDVADVDLNRTAITDEWLACLSDLPRMKRLNLAYTAVSDAGIVSLPRLAELRSAYLTGTMISDRSIEHLARHCPDLRTLVVGGPGITNAGLRKVSRFRKLQTLALTNAQITDSGLASLGEQNAIETTDGAPPQLSSLQRLSIAHSPISDAGIATLTKLKSLSSLYLFDTNVTGEGIERLRQSLPSCTISRLSVP